MVREYEFRAPVTVSLMTERRTTAPYGLFGGSPGAAGRNSVSDVDGAEREVSGHATLELDAGDRLCVETPGGGGYGPPD